LVLEVDSERSRGFSRDVVERERERRGTSRSAVIGVDGVLEGMGAGGVPAHGGLEDSRTRDCDDADDDEEESSVTRKSGRYNTGKVRWW
jgi:hypothetical protein